MSFYGLTPKTPRTRRLNHAARVRRMERALREGREDQEEPGAAEKASFARPDEAARTPERPAQTDEERRKTAAEAEVERILAAAQKAGVGVVDLKDEDSSTAAPEEDSPQRPARSDQDESAVDDEVQRLRRAGEAVGVRFKDHGPGG